MLTRGTQLLQPPRNLQFNTKAHGQVRDVYFGCNKYSYWNIIFISQIPNPII